jgi:hypothetical protein
MGSKYFPLQIAGNHNVDIRVFGCKPYQSRGGRGLVRLSSNENMNDILNEIRSHKGVTRASFSRESDQAVMGEVIIDKCAACNALKQSDCFMLSSKSGGEGWLDGQLRLKAIAPYMT